MVAVHILDSRDKPLALTVSEKNITEESALCKSRQEIARNRTSFPQPINKRSIDQAFHDAENKMVSDKELQNKVATLKQQVLEKKLAAL